MLLLPQPVHPLEVHPPTHTDEQLMHSLAAVPWIRLHQTTQLRDQTTVRIHLPGAIPLCAPRLGQRPACPAFRDLLMLQATADLLHRPAPTLGVYKFGRAASLRI